MSVNIMITVCPGVQSQKTMMLATRWAKQFGGTITGLGVVDVSAVIPIPAMALPGVNSPLAAPDNALVVGAMEKVQDLLRKFGDKCMQDGLDYHLVENVAISQDQILEEAQSHDVILLGKPEVSESGPSFSTKNLIEDLLRHSPRPVVMVPDAAQKGQGILVAYDGSLQAARALQALIASGLSALGKVTVLSVSSEFHEAGTAPAKRAVEYLAAHGVDAVEYQVTDKAAEHAIVEEAKHRNVELIVMGAYGQSKLAEFFLGSTTRNVINESVVPLFLFH